MNTEIYTNLISNPDILKDHQTSELKKIIKEYPYFQSARALYLKGLNNQESFRYNNELKTTAAFTSDRTVLFDFITSTSFENTADIHHQISQKIAQQDVFEFQEILPNIEQELALGTPINFSKNETHSFQQWLQISVQKPIKREGLETKKNDKEFYAMANGGLSTLVYASWTNDKKLAAKEINHTFNEIDRLFYKDGYINDNSFRGGRGQWYHSYGVNIALGYVYIAKLWGAEVPEKVQSKLVNSAKVVNLAITNHDKFAERKNPNGLARNRITSKENTQLHTHQMAIAIDTLMEIVVGIELEHDPKYLQLRKFHTPDGTDDLIGFNPNCIH